MSAYQKSEDEEIEFFVKYSTDFTEIGLMLAGDTPITPEEFIAALRYFIANADPVALFSEDPMSEIKVQ